MIARVNRFLRAVGHGCLVGGAVLALYLTSDFSWHGFVTVALLLAFWIGSLFLPKS